MKSVNWRETIKLWGFTLLKIPMIFWLKPKVLAFTDEKSVIQIAFKRRTQNHLKSMYFGALCVGAELAPGLLALRLIEKQSVRCAFLFKDFSAAFLKRCEADATFVCDQGKAISDAIAKTIATKERENVTLTVIATAPQASIAEDEIIARFTMTISIKAK